MKPLVVAIWMLTVDNGAADPKPIKQVLEDKAALVEGSGGQCRVSAVFPDNSRMVICRIGEVFTGIRMTCKQSDATLVLIDDSTEFRVTMTCSTPEGSKH